MLVLLLISCCYCVYVKNVYVLSFLAMFPIVLLCVRRVCRILIKITYLYLLLTDTHCV